MPRVKILEKDKEKCLIKVATIITKELKESGKLPRGEEIQKKLNELTKQEDDFSKKKFSLTDISRLKIEAIERYINFSSISVVSEIDEKLSEKMESKFGLKKAIVVNNKHIDVSEQSYNEYLGKKAAEYLSNDIKSDPSENIKNFLNENAFKYIETKIPKDHLKDLTKYKDIVFSCGSSVGAVIDFLNENENFHKSTVYSSIILITNSFKETTPSDLIHKFTYKFKGSTGITFQIPKEILTLDIESIAKDNDLLQRSYFYKKAIKPTLEKTLDAEYLVLGVGGILKKDDEKSGGFSHLVKTTCWDKFSEYCVGELSYWPILRKKENIQEGEKGVEETIWLWDYVRDMQKKHMNKKATVEYRDQPEEEEIYSYFKNFFWQTYTSNFNKLIKKKKIYADSVNNFNKMFEGKPSDKIDDEIKLILGQVFKKNETMTLEQGLYNFLKEIKKRKVIVPAGGKGKEDAIHQCLTYKSNFIDVLITDSAVAANLLKR